MPDSISLPITVVKNNVDIFQFIELSSVTFSNVDFINIILAEIWQWTVFVRNTWECGPYRYISLLRRKESVFSFSSSANETFDNNKPSDGTILEKKNKSTLNCIGEQPTINGHKNY